MHVGRCSGRHPRLPRRGTAAAAKPPLLVPPQQQVQSRDAASATYPNWGERDAATRVGGACCLLVPSPLPSSSSNIPPCRSLRREPRYPRATPLEGEDLRPLGALLEGKASPRHADSLGGDADTIGTERTRASLIRSSCRRTRRCSVSSAVVSRDRYHKRATRRTLQRKRPAR